MARFKIVKKFLLDFLGGEWKDSYINFGALTVMDVKESFPALSKLDEKSQDDVTRGVDSITTILKKKFIDGKGIGEKGEVIDLKPEDFEELPIEVLSKALSFLSQSAVAPSPTP